MAPAAPTDDQVKAIYRSLTPRVSLDRIRQVYSDIGAFGSRLAGSKAEAKTFDYVEGELRALGAVNIHRDTFPVTVPDPEAVGHLSVDGRQVQLWPLWPNLVRTSTCSVTGNLIYGGDGSLEALRGMEVRGSIVVLEFDSSSRWRNAAKLGAKAIVFVQPDEMPRAEAEAKFGGVPIDVPRFYLPLKHAGPVLTAAFHHQSARLQCRQDWVQRQSCNLVADLPGSSRSEPVTLMAYADAMSVVPGIDPGGEEIGGIAAMLESARIWSQSPHTRTLRLVLSGAHCLALRGAREYVDRLITTSAPPSLLTITLDLSSGGQAIGSYGRGWFYEFRDESQENLKSVSRLFRAHADLLASLWGLPNGRFVLVDAVNNSDGRTWKNNIPGRFALDCEPMVNAGMNALTFRTVEDSRETIDTPFDIVQRVELANVLRQARTLAAMSYHALNDTTDKAATSDYMIPLDPATPSRMSLIGGFAVAKGEVDSYDPLKSFVPDVPIDHSLAAVLADHKTFMGVRGDMVQLTGPGATYRFAGLAPATSYASGLVKETQLAAFHIDDRTGNIDYAPSLGTYGDYSYATAFELKTAERRSPIVVFKCKAVDLYDLVDPQDLKALVRVRVLDANTDSSPQDFGIFSPGYDQRLNPEIEDVQVLFLMPGQEFKLLGGSLLGETRLILTNSSLGDEEGKGYIGPGGPPGSGRSAIAESGVFPDLPLNTAKDIVAINETRLRRFAKYRIVSPEMESLQKSARKEEDAAEKAEAARDWPDAARHARAAWGFALRAHPVIQTTANDVVNGVVFYLFLLIPFSYFMERLLAGNQLLTKQLAWSIGIFIASFLLLRLIHPAFEIVTNPAMIFVAFVMGALSLVVISFILGKFETSLKAVQKQQSGVHEVDIRRASVSLAAFNLGVSNMRRRKARTVLTTLTLVVMTFIVLSFTSIVSEIQLTEFPSDNPANYSGMLIRDPGLEPLQLATYRQISNEFAGKARVVRRAYYYGADIGDTGILTLQRADHVAEVRAMLGLDPDESKVLRPQLSLLPGGRWFKPGERNAMILPLPLAEQLKIDPSDVGKATVRYAGVEYKVVGIADPAILRASIDLDGDPFLPPDFSLSKQYQEQKGSTNKAFRSYIRLDPSVVFILPAETALDLGADLRTLAVQFDDPYQTKKALDELMPRLRLNLYASVPAAKGQASTSTLPTSASSVPLRVSQFSVLEASKGTGLGLVLIQLVIASVFVLNTMIASVYERTKEIGIFSAIGLAPNHIAMLFFAESLVYGVLGAVIGYFCAQATAKVIVATGALPGLTLNFSSTSAVMSAALVMGVVLLSTIYPAKRASQIAAPAMSEEVFQTEPEGDVWRLPLPFSISEQEAAPMMEFLAEWLKGYEEFTIGDFVTSQTEIHPEPGGVIAVTAIAWLAPYDLGISQKLNLKAGPSIVERIYQLDLTLVRLAGDPENWPTVNQRFLANLRKQFLTWRTLDKTERERYMEQSRVDLAGLAAETVGTE